LSAVSRVVRRGVHRPTSIAPIRRLPIALRSARSHFTEKLRVEWLNRRGGRSGRRARHRCSAQLRSVRAMSQVGSCAESSAP